MLPNHAEALKGSFAFLSKQGYSCCAGSFLTDIIPRNATRSLNGMETFASATLPGRLVWKLPVAGWRPASPKRAEEHNPYDNSRAAC